MNGKIEEEEKLAKTKSELKMWKQTNQAEELLNDESTNLEKWITIRIRGITQVTGKEEELIMGLSEPKKIIY